MIFWSVTFFDVCQDILSNFVEKIVNAFTTMESKYFQNLVIIPKLVHQRYGKPGQSIDECFLEFLLDQGVAAKCIEQIVLDSEFCESYYHSNSVLVQDKAELLPVLEDLEKV